MGFFNFFTKEKKETLDQGLEKTKESFFGKLARAVAGNSGSWPEPSQGSRRWMTKSSTIWRKCS